MSGQETKSILDDIRNYSARAIDEHAKYLRWRRRRTKAQRRAADAYHVEVIGAGHRDPMLPGPADRLLKLLQIEAEQADLSRIDGSALLNEIHQEMGQILALKAEAGQTIEAILSELESMITENCDLTGADKLNLRTYFMRALEKIKEL